MADRPTTPAEWLEQQRRRHGLERFFRCEKARCMLSRLQCIKNQESQPRMVENKGEQRVASWQDPFLTYCRSGDCAQGKENRKVKGALKVIRAERKKAKEES